MFLKTSRVACARGENGTSIAPVWHKWSRKYFISHTSLVPGSFMCILSHTLSSGVHCVIVATMQANFLPVY